MPISSEGLLSGISVEKACDATARLIIRRRGRTGEPMCTLVNVGACLYFESAQRAKYDLRHLRGRSVVEVVQTRIRETWKFAFDRSGVKALIRSAKLHLSCPFRSSYPSTSTMSRRRAGAAKLASLCV